MNIVEVIMDTMKQMATEFSEGTEMDKYWKNVLPEVLDFMANEVFLTSYRRYINELMKQSAFKISQSVAPRSTKLEPAMLVLHYWARTALSDISEDSQFQALVDQGFESVKDTADYTVSLGWEERSGVWLPYSEQITDKVHKQIFFSLIERYKQMLFAELCYAELVRRGRQSKHLKYAYVLRNKSNEFHHQQRQKEAYEWLHKESNMIVGNLGIDADVGADSLHDWLEKIVKTPPLLLHVQIQRAALTKKAIRDGAIDIQRRGGQREHVPFDDELAPDDSIIDTIEGLVSDECPKRLMECRSQIENLLSNRKLKLGKRRFKVFQKMCTEDRQCDIAKQLGISAATVTRDKEVIHQNRHTIKELLEQ